MKKIAVFMLFGQSNAVGHAMPMEKEDYIHHPLACLELYLKQIKLPDLL